MTTDARPAWAPTGPFPQKVVLRDGTVATIEYLPFAERPEYVFIDLHRARWWDALGRYRLDGLLHSRDIVGPYLEPEKEPVQEPEPDYIELTATVRVPKGPWQKTHRLTGEVRCPKAGEPFIGLGSAVEIAGYDFQKSMNVILEPLPPPWEPPSHLKGKGASLRVSIYGQVELIPKGGRVLVVSDCVGLPNEIGDLLGFISFPPLKPGESIELR